MKGKIIKENNGYTLFVDGKVFGDTDGHPLKSITNRLSLKNCQSIERGYDLDELLKKEIANGKLHPNDGAKKEGIERGIQIALEIFGDKKFSEEDMRIAFFHVQNSPFFNEFIQSLQQTEWDVEIMMEPCYYDDSLGGFSTSYKEGMPTEQPQTDSDGCIVLKRINL